jgi:hypothetical protein
MGRRITLRTAEGVGLISGQDPPGTGARILTVSLGLGEFLVASQRGGKGEEGAEQVGVAFVTDGQPAEWAKR